jgi:hypothetical protein
LDFIFEKELQILRRYKKAYFYVKSALDFNNKFYENSLY